MHFALMAYDKAKDEKSFFSFSGLSAECEFFSKSMLKKTGKKSVKELTWNDVASFCNEDASKFLLFDKWLKIIIYYI